LNDKSSSNAAADDPSGSTPAGIYVHVPFCRSKCPYCDFYSVTETGLISDYIAALPAELSRSKSLVAAVDSVYFGGGTPSLLTPGQIGRILEHLNTDYSVTADAEITLEVNPGTTDRSRLAAYRDAGVNRLSIGLQSIDDRALRFLGRIHSAAQGIDTYGWARQAGFENLGLDLIYGIPGQTPDRWEDELATVCGLAPEHLSCYMLTMEKGTPMAEKVLDGRLRPLEEKVAGELFDCTAGCLTANGYHWYEVSNFARRFAAVDRRSRHNRKYWTFAPYLGFGPAAHSFVGNRRWWNHRSLSRYLAAVASGRSPVEETETLTREQRIMEFVYLGLRQTEGIDAADFKTRFGADFYDRYKPEASRLIREGWMEKTPKGVRLTKGGMRFLERVVDRLLGRS